VIEHDAALYFGAKSWAICGQWPTTLHLLINARFERC
jgi:hypothetical protein